MKKIKKMKIFSLRKNKNGDTEFHLHPGGFVMIFVLLLFGLLM